MWLAIHHAEAETAAEASRPRNAVRRFPHPRLSAPARSVGADPERVKALIDGTVAAFQAHGDQASAAVIAARLAIATGQPAGLIAQALLDDGRAVLGVTDRLVYPRGTGVQWNPADHLCMAGQVLCQEALPAVTSGRCLARSTPLSRSIRPDEAEVEDSVLRRGLRERAAARQRHFCERQADHLRERATTPWMNNISRRETSVGPVPGCPPD